MALARPSAVYWFGLHISLFFFLKSLYRIPPPFMSLSLFLTHTHSHTHLCTHTAPYFIPTSPTHTHTHTHTSTHTRTHTHKHTECSIAQLHCKSMSLLSLLLCFVNCSYSTVTDLAKFLGKSTCKKRKPFFLEQITCDQDCTVHIFNTSINGRDVFGYLDLLHKMHSLHVN